MKKQILLSESLSASSKRLYSPDFKRVDNNSCYIQFTRSEQPDDSSYKRRSFVVFENYIEGLIFAFINFVSPL